MEVGLGWEGDGEAGCEQGIHCRIGIPRMWFKIPIRCIRIDSVKCKLGAVGGDVQRGVEPGPSGGWGCGHWGWEVGFVGDIVVFCALGWKGTRLGL